VDTALGDGPLFLAEEMVSGCASCSHPSRTFYRRVDLCQKSKDFVCPGTSSGWLYFPERRSHVHDLGYHPEDAADPEGADTTPGSSARVSRATGLASDPLLRAGPDSLGFYFVYLSSI